jgi:hypothetical protein
VRMWKWFTKRKTSGVMRLDSVESADPGKDYTSIGKEQEGAFAIVACTAHTPAQ